MNTSSQQIIRHSYRGINILVMRKRFNEWRGQIGATGGQRSDAMTVLEAKVVGCTNLAGELESVLNM